MSRIEIPVLETTVQKMHIWLKDLAQAMGWENQYLAYQALRAVLHALRDRLSVEVAAKFGAQLPMLIRGIYYEGWVPAQTPIKIHSREDFFILVSKYLGNDQLIEEVDLITETVFKVMSTHLGEGELEHIKKLLPKHIALLF